MAASLCLDLSDSHVPDRVVAGFAQHDGGSLAGRVDVGPQVRPVGGFPDRVGGLARLGIIQCRVLMEVALRVREGAGTQGQESR